MKHLEGKTRMIKTVVYAMPWLGVVLLVVYIFWLNVPLVSLSTRGCEGTECTRGITAVQNTKEEWKDGAFLETSNALHVKKQPLEISFLNPPAAQELSLVLEWTVEPEKVPAEAYNVQLSDDKEFSSVIAQAIPLVSAGNDGRERVSVKIILPDDHATRKWFLRVEGSQGREISSIQINTLSEPSLFAKLRSWWRNTHL